MLEFILCAISGALVKIVDHFEDELHRKDWWLYLIAIFYGAIIGYLIGNSTFGLLFLAAIIAQIITNKVDKKTHALGVLVAAIVALLFQGPTLEIWILGYLLILASLDEIDAIELIKPFTKYRLFLKIGTLPFILFGRFDYAISIWIFDIAYEATKKGLEKIR